MNLVGKKVLLRAIEPYDNDVLREMINDPETEHLIGGGSFPVSEAGQAKWIEAQSSNASILRCIIAPLEERKNGIGTIILSDIDYKNGLGHVHIKLSSNEGRGKGYGTDALLTLMQYAFQELRINCLYAGILSYNEVSQKLFKKCGFVQEGVMRSRVFKNGNYNDVFSYSILKDEWEDVKGNWQ